MCQRRMTHRTHKKAHGRLDGGALWRLAKEIRPQEGRDSKGSDAPRTNLFSSQPSA